MHTGRFSQEGLDIKLSTTKLDLQRNSEDKSGIGINNKEVYSSPSTRPHSTYKNKLFAFKYD